MSLTKAQRVALQCLARHRSLFARLGRVTYIASNPRILEEGEPTPRFLSATIAALKESGLVTVRANDRYTYVHLTDAGRAEATRIAGGAS